MSMRFLDIHVRSHRNWARLLIGLVCLHVGIGLTNAAPLPAAGTPLAGMPLVPSDDTKTKEAAAFRAGLNDQFRGNSSSAKAHFQEALKLNQKYVPALIAMAGLSQAEGKGAEADQYLKRAEGLEPASASVHLAWGRLYQARGQVEKAEFSMKKAATILPHATAPLISLAELYLLQPSRREDALNIARRACEIEPDNKFAQYLRGIAAAATGHTSEAFVAFDKTARLAPKDAASLQAIGRLHLEGNSVEKAIQAFDAGLARQPNSVALMLDRTDALARTGRWSEALMQLAKAEQIAPKLAEIPLKQGDVYQASKRWDEALMHYAKALNLAPGLAIAYNNMAWALLSAGRREQQAIAAAKKAVSLSPGSAPFIDTLGWSERAGGDLKSARITLKKAVDLDPKVAIFQYHYGVVLSELREDKVAALALEAALSLDRNFDHSEDVKRRLKILEGS